jgi:hypothetical protein
MVGSTNPPTQQAQSITSWRGAIECRPKERGNVSTKSSSPTFCPAARRRRGTLKKPLKLQGKRERMLLNVNTGEEAYAAYEL